MTDAPATPAVSPNHLIGAWAIVASVASVAIGVAIGPDLVGVVPDPTHLAVLGLLAGAILASGLVAIARTPGASPTVAFLGLVAAAAALTALQTVAPTVTPHTPFAIFLVVGPWRYLLLPVVLHFALELAWHHQQRHWRGMIVGWYALHVALFVATAGGLATGEAPLVNVVDGFFLRQTFEPIGTTLAIGAVVLSLASPNRRKRHRQGVMWTLAALLLGLMPMIVVSLFPELPARLGFPTDAPFATLPLLAFFGLAGILSLPMVNPLKRDMAAHRLAQRLLDNADLPSGLREVAEQLRNTFEAEAVVVRVATPPTEVTLGTPSRERPDGPFVPDAETFDQRRAVVAPIGRSGDPLGEVYLEGRFPGAFGRREQGWLMAFLGPISSAVRVRRREAEREAQLATNAELARELSRQLAHATGLLPELTPDDGRGIPLPVDASEVLQLLSSSTRAIGDESEGVEAVVAETRAHVRAASDAIAHALDGLHALGTQLLTLTRRSDAIAGINDKVSGVAFRTNLLANTAALEASRAGTAGRTFAVLAEEIRRLADGAAEASTAILDETTGLVADTAAIETRLFALRGALTNAIHEAEASEDSARQMGELAGSMESRARGLWPAIEEANTVAARRSARDTHLTETLEQFLAERGAVTTALSAHRDAIDRLSERLERLARVGRSTRPRQTTR